jgi:spermidine/putrescine transport system substrate-binding protein
MKKLMIAACAVLLAAGMMTACTKSDKVTLNVYNWGDYIDAEVLTLFEKETGIRVNYETFATNEDMYAKMKQGGTDYDVLFPSDYMIARMIREGMLEELDYSMIPNARAIQPGFKGLEYDPENRFSVPYMWGTFGILYNRTMVEGPVDSWNILWNPEYKRQVLMMDSVRDTMAIALIMLDYSINTTDRGQLEQARDLLIAQKPMVLAYVGDNGKDMMIGGEAALQVSWSGDAVYVRDQNPDLLYVIPKEGTNRWVDAMVIPKSSKHKKEALLFIDFMNRPDIAFRNVDYIGYSTPNQAAFDQLDDEVKNDPAAYPAPDVIERTEIFVDIGDAVADYDRYWTEIKSE